MFKKAVRSLAKIKIAITGPSGSGKTYGALRLASGMGGKIAVIDTENGSASLYSDRFEFDVVDLSPPFTTGKYIEAINYAVKAGYDILIIDSLSHAWAGEGGILERKGQKDARGGNSYTNWAEFTREQEKLTSTILQSKIHIIANMRSKQEYAVVAGDNNKTKVQKLGLAPIQRDGQEYEYTIVFDVAMNHEAETSKDRTGLFTDKISTLSEDIGKTIVDWINSGSKPKPESLNNDPDKIKDIPDNDEAKKENHENAEKPNDIKSEIKKVHNVAPIGMARSVDLKTKIKSLSQTWSNEDLDRYIGDAFGKFAHDLNEQEAMTVFNYCSKNPLKEDNK